MLKAVPILILGVALSGCTGGGAARQGLLQRDPPESASPGPSPGGPIAVAAQPASRSAADPAAATELERLKARAAELERQVSALPPVGVEAMLGMVTRGEAATLSGELEKLLLKGEPGYAIIHSFLQEADVQHEKIDLLTHHPQLIFAILRVAALHPDQVAACASFLMKATRDQPKSWLRREMFNFLPVFINHHQGEYPQLRRDMEEDIVHQLKTGAAYPNKLALALRDLDFKPPAELFYPTLIDPTSSESHGAMIEQLLARKGEGLLQLKRYLEEVKDFTTPTAGAVVRAIAKLEGARSETVERLMEHENLNLRYIAYFAYYSEPREESELTRVIELLNAKQCPLTQKRSFVSLVAQKSPSLFNLLFDQVDASINDEAVKKLVLRTAETVAKRRASKGKDEASKPPPESQTPPAK